MQEERRTSIQLAKRIVRKIPETLRQNYPIYDIECFSTHNIYL